MVTFMYESGRKAQKSWRKLMKTLKFKRFHGKMVDFFKFLKNF
ncbi:hypothetical protein DFQ01_11941 [Paenibacillus cellulosilyticus]|uniref:Uncharacterized protein n=1 Tax=Paenibacillus cellulosilyticus TaxID=375489 RepID=A0A2V2YPJ8_9BACL|nr:hypothetical protein DFQ01_11941 [Paenibacillus cellulosilyticus]